ncbi:unnamed protein product [Bursaphelenchus okinawaensis]|uniref:Uncharacterized protein n=1 Tax=Bursaphelenchus okinawaensis TaxID=465554 RepID=A0A811L8U0_9BILA|nr:unnamed protein product [Bursaphelenchus okinawaensis]CAG9118196.1 unnamed protein product [Bursaphelenchus okinawaensis]
MSDTDTISDSDTYCTDSTFCSESDTESTAVEETKKLPKVLRKTCLDYFLSYRNVLNGVAVEVAQRVSDLTEDVLTFLMTSERVLKHFMGGQQSVCALQNGQACMYKKEISFATRKPSLLVAIKGVLYPNQAIIGIGNMERRPAEKYTVEIIYKGIKLNVKLVIPFILYSRVVQQVLVDLQKELSKTKDILSGEGFQGWHYHGVPVLTDECRRKVAVIHMANHLWKSRTYFYSTYDMRINSKPQFLSVADEYLADMLDNPCGKLFLPCVNFLCVYQYLPLSPQAEAVQFHFSVKFHDIFDIRTFDLYRTILDDFKRVKAKRVKLYAKMYIDCREYEQLKLILKRTRKAFLRMKQLQLEYRFMKFEGFLRVYMPISQKHHDADFITDMRELSERRNFCISPDRWKFIALAKHLELQIICSFADEPELRLHPDESIVMKE